MRASDGGVGPADRHRAVAGGDVGRCGEIWRDLAPPVDTAQRQAALQCGSCSRQGWQVAIADRCLAVNLLPLCLCLCLCLSLAPVASPSPRSPLPFAGGAGASEPLFDVNRRPRRGVRAEAPSLGDPAAPMLAGENGLVDKSPCWLRTE